MFGLFKKIQPIGIDFGHSSIRMIQLSESEGRISVAAAAQTDFPPEICRDHDKRMEFAYEAIEQMLIRGRFSGREAVAALANNYLKVKTLRTSLQMGDSFEENLFAEACGRFNLDQEKYALNYLIAGDVPGSDEVKKEVILFAAEKDAINERIALLEKIGLTPVGLDIIPCALFRSAMPFMRREADMNAVKVIVDVGRSSTTITVGQGHDISFVKTLPIAGQRFNELVAARLDIEPYEAALLRKRMMSHNSDFEVDEATSQAVNDAISMALNELAREISLCFRYYSVTFRGHRPEKLILSGAEAYEKVLLEELQSRVAIQVELANPLKTYDLSNVDVISERDGHYSEWTVAVGLALKNIIRSSEREVCCERH